MKKTAFLVLSSLASVNEAISFQRSVRVVSVGSDADAVGSSTRVFSKEEVMATMTVERAAATFMRMNHSKVNKKLVALVQRLATQSRGEGDSDADAAPTGYAAVDTARDMLNDMIDEATMKKELDGVDCSEAGREQFAMLKQVEHGISYDNAQASASKAESLRAGGVIAILQEDKLPTNREELKKHNARCAVNLATLKQQLAIVTADIEVMKRILQMVCANDVRTTPAAGQLPVLLQDDVASEESDLIKCVSCMTGRQAAWVRHNRFSTMLNSIKSQVAKDYIEENLLAEFDDKARRMPTAVRTVLLEEEEIKKNIPGINVPALNTRLNTSDPPAPKTGACNEQMTGVNSSTYKGCQKKTLSGRSCQSWSTQSPHKHTITPALYNASGIGDHSYCRNPNGRETIWCYTTDQSREWEYCQPLLDLKAPNGVSKHVCVEANMCKLNKAECTNLRDRFLVIMAGILDTQSKLSDDIATLEGQCKETKEDYERTISSLEAQLKEENKNLAAATKSMTQSQAQSADGNAKHKVLSAAYTKKMTACCEQSNSYTAEICALSKIRGELYKLEGQKVLIIDCEVADWVDEECSVTCGGGSQKRTRAVLMHPVNGSQCPPLKMERSCNVQGCPVDCKVNDWTGWSECTADCGGGVQSRNRQRTVSPENGGDACPETSESRDCNTFACNADCVLNDWGDWSLCSKACAGGHSERTKTVATPERGQGSCPAPMSDDRLDFQDCNTFDCTQLLPPGRHILQCKGMLDLIIILDGSGSLGKYGWDESKSMARQLMSSLIGGPENVNVGLLLFSGPNNWEDLMTCAGSDPNAKPTDEACGMQWISHLTENISDVLKKSEDMEWPRATTLTSLALSKASSELIGGRQDAMSVVMVVTDGKPMSPIKTRLASEAIKKKARLMWVPVGKAVKSSIKDMKVWSSEPWEDNVVDIDTFSVLDTPATLNKMISGFCDTVQ